MRLLVADKKQARTWCSREKNVLITCKSKYKKAGFIAMAVVDVFVILA
jgi:hypothetical protein